MNMTKKSRVVFSFTIDYILYQDNLDHIITSIATKTEFVIRMSLFTVQRLGQFTVIVN